MGPYNDYRKARQEAQQQQLADELIEE